MLRIALIIGLVLALYSTRTFSQGMTVSIWYFNIC